MKAKNKPNWDTYDSWGGMLAFNRDRIYQGSVEAAAFRKLFNLWTWQTNDTVRSITEQLELQPPGVPDGTAGPDHRITRATTGGANDGHINFGFDSAPPVVTEPPPSGTEPAITTAYEFNRAAGTGTATSVTRGGAFVTLHQSTQPTNDEGRGVELFDRLSASTNPQRIADELVNHRVATGNVPIDVRPIALAIAQRCITVNGGSSVGATQTVTSTPALSAASTAALAFFNARHGLTSFDQVYDDTRLRSDAKKGGHTEDPAGSNDRIPMCTIPTRRCLLRLRRSSMVLSSSSATTSAGTSVSLERLRQEVFRRHIDAGSGDNTVMNGIYVDREITPNTEPVALFRYFLEPLGVSVDKWSMGVRGRSLTYTFADVFGGYTSTLAAELKASLGISSALMSTQVCDLVVPMVDTALASLPPADGPGAIPTYTDIQRIFNKNCIECHGGLGYPPYHTYGTSLNLSEDENPPAGARRLTRPYNMAHMSQPTQVTVEVRARGVRIIRSAEAIMHSPLPCTSVFGLPSPVHNYY